MSIELPPDAEDVVVVPYGGPDCCCGDPECRDFEDRMAAWGIPLEELNEVTFKMRLRGGGHGDTGC